jgi:hypothetical protein
MKPVTTVRCKRCGSIIDSAKLQLDVCKCTFVGVDNDGRIIGEPEDYEIILEPRSYNGR